MPLGVLLSSWSGQPLDKPRILHRSVKFSSVQFSRSALLATELVH